MSFKYGVPPRPKKEKPLQGIIIKTYCSSPHKHVFEWDIIRSWCNNNYGEWQYDISRYFNDDGSVNLGFKTIDEAFWTWIVWS